jgi:hypothetical protein
MVDAANVTLVRIECPDVTIAGVPAAVRCAPQRVSTDMPQRIKVRFHTRSAAYWV